MTFALSNAGVREPWTTYLLNNDGKRKTDGSRYPREAAGFSEADKADDSRAVIGRSELLANSRKKP
jgi:hypothetical protein